MKVEFSTGTVSEFGADGVVVGLYNDYSVPEGSGYSGDLKSVLEHTSFKGKVEQVKILYSLEGVRAKRVAVVGLGDKAKFAPDVARKAAAVGAKALRKDGCKTVGVDAFGSEQAATEGVILGLYRFDELMTMNPDSRPDLDTVTVIGDNQSDFERGKIIAESQNFARRLGELPANIATPTFFVEETKHVFKGIDKVDIKVHDTKWAEKQKMGAFLSVTRGSHQPAKFMVIEYKGGDAGEKPFAVVGKGITFDTGGISLKPSAGMGAMRGDCSGAAATIGTLLAIARLGLKTNVVGVTPLTENMPGGSATKPSDVVFASNGKSIEIDNTDAEGRLILSDALVYAEKTYEPHTIVDIATLTGAMMIALGEHYIGAFTPSSELWNELEEVGKETSEEFWRMPVDSRYSKQLKSTIADLKNVGGRPAGSITAAMFLKEFVTIDRWAHLDIAGTAWPSSERPYVPKGNAGIPVRALVELAAKFSS